MVASQLPDGGSTEWGRAASRCYLPRQRTDSPATAALFRHGDPAAASARGRRPVVRRPRPAWICCNSPMLHGWPGAVATHPALVADLDLQHQEPRQRPRCPRALLGQLRRRHQPEHSGTTRLELVDYGEILAQG